MPGQNSHLPPRPRIIGLTVVKNEQDIIEPSIRHNAALLDALIVVDNGSVDATRTIALALARELGNVVLTDWAKFGYTQSEWTTRLLHAAQGSFFADYVLFLDADEFIGVPNRDTFEAALAAIPPGGVGAMPWRNYVLTPETLALAAQDPPHHIHHRRVQENQCAVKIVLRLDGKQRPGLVVQTGSHAVCDGLGVPLPGVLLPHLPLWHFPIRSQDQLAAKAVVGWMACLTIDPYAAEGRKSYHWRDMYDRVVTGQGIDAADLCALSVHYADVGTSLGRPPTETPPLVRDAPAIATLRRHSTGTPLDPLVLVSRSWAQTLAAPPSAVPGVDAAPWRFLAEKHQPQSVLECGCRNGAYLDLFAQFGVPDLAGIGDAPAETLALTRGGYVQHDPATPFSLGRRYSLVLSRVANPTPEWLDNLVRHAERQIVFATGHDVEIDLAACLAAFNQRGWRPDLVDTLALRCLASCPLLRRSLLVLRPATAPNIADGTAALLEIADQTARQPPQSSRVAGHPAPTQAPAWALSVTEDA